MAVKPTLAVVLLALMVGAWWWTLSQPVFRSTAAATAHVAAAPGAEGSDTPPDVALYRLRAGGPSALPVRRDPFTATGSTSPASTANSRQGTPPHGSAQAGTPSSQGAPTPPLPRLDLIGVATPTSGGGTRVAVLADERGVVHAAPGDLVADVYRVDTVDEDAVTVTVLPEQRVLRLRLK